MPFLDLAMVNLELTDTVSELVSATNPYFLAVTFPITQINSNSSLSVFQVSPDPLSSFIL